MALSSSSDVLRRPSPAAVGGLAPSKEPRGVPLSEPLDTGRLPEVGGGDSGGGGTDRLVFGIGGRLLGTGGGGLLGTGDPELLLAAS